MFHKKTNEMNVYSFLSDGDMAVMDSLAMETNPTSMLPVILNSKTKLKRYHVEELTPRLSRHKASFMSSEEEAR